MRSYTFADLVTFSECSPNEAKHWVQQGVIRPDIRESTGTGAHRAFGFLDVFEASVARKLNQIPGGMPIARLSNILDVLRFEVESSTLIPTPWGAFVNPATRDPATVPLWIAATQSDAPRVIEDQACDLLLTDGRDAVVLLRLDTILLDLEQRTQDHATIAESADAFSKRPAVSAQSVIEAAMARELAAAGLSGEQVAIIFTQLHEKLNALRPELRASATFVRFVEMVDALVTIRGAGPNYPRWRQEVTAFMATWNKKKTGKRPSDDRLVQLVVAREAERAGEGKSL